MRFEEAYEGWNEERLTQGEAARLLGVCERSFRRYVVRFEADGLEGLIDRRLEQVSHRRAPVDEVMALTDRYRTQHAEWNVKHFHSWYRRAVIRVETFSKKNSKLKLREAFCPRLCTLWHGYLNARLKKRGAGGWRFVSQPRKWRSAPGSRSGDGSGMAAIGS